MVNSALRALDLELSAQERNALASRGTSQPVAYDFYLRGRGYLQEYQKPENIESAIQLFTRALESDPGFALGYAGLGESYWQKYEHSHDNEWVAKALEACQRANTTGFGHNCSGHVTTARVTTKTLRLNFSTFCRPIVQTTTPTADSPSPTSIWGR